MSINLSSLSTSALAGPVGATGATGIQGASGSTGFQGASGSTGIQGASGSTGFQGASGSTGIQGASGSTGIQGASGSTGFQGASGSTGLTGATGVQGPTGGASGPGGATGSTGPSGATGAGGADSVGSLSIVSGALTIDISQGPIYNLTLTENINSITFTNLNAVGKVQAAILVITNNGTLYSITWPPSVEWANGIAPTLTGTNGKKDVLSLFSSDTGTTWNAIISGQNI